MCAEPTGDETEDCGPRLRRRIRSRVGFLCWLMIGLTLVGAISRAWWYRADPAELCARGTILMDRDPAEAERLFRQALALTDGKLPRATAELCLLQLRKGEWEAARQLMSELNPEDCADHVLLEFARHAHRHNHPDPAITALNIVRLRTPENTLAALDLLVRIYQEQQQDRKLLDCVRETALRLRSEPAVWWKLLELTDARQLSTESIDCLRLALDQQLPARDQLEMRHQLIARFVGQGQIVEARELLDQLPKAEQTSPRAQRHLAAVCRLEGQPQLALQALESAQSLDLKHPGVAWLRGQIRFDLEQFAEAIRDFELVLNADPFDLTVHLRIADALRRTNQPDAADRHEATAREIRAKRQQINRLCETARRQPDNDSVMRQLAELYRELHDLRAADYWQNRSANKPARLPPSAAEHRNAP